MSSNTIPTDSLFRSNTQFPAPLIVNKVEPVRTSTASHGNPPGALPPTATTADNTISNTTATITTTTSTTAPSTALAATIGTANVPATPGIEQTTAASFPTKKDLSNIPPAFFVGPRENESDIVIESQLSSDSESFGYKNRRLSKVLTQDKDKEDEKKEEKPVEVPAKRIILSAADASRGIFGDKRLKALSSNSMTVTATEVSNTNNNNTSAESSHDTAKETSMPEPPKTIRVFGYPTNLTHDVVQYFMTFGKIEEYKETLGRWMTIRYDSSAAALAALNGNGVIISKNYMIGVALEPKESSTTASHEVVQRMKPIEDIDSVYKSFSKKSDSGLGSGKVGISASDKNNANDPAASKIFANVGVMTKLRDYLLSW